MIKLPSILTTESWFYKENEELCKPHLGKPYISYSSVDSWGDYKEDFIKQKLVGIKLPDGIYGLFGSYAGEALETGIFPEENPHGFTGQENLKLDELWPDGAVYEKMIIIDRGEYIILGFIDRYLEKDGKAKIRDQKTGGSKKEVKYESEEYIQVILYAYAIELLGKEVEETDVYFIRRTGSHVNPPLHISTEQFVIPLAYNKERVDFALKKVDKSVKEISDIFVTYDKYFGKREK